MQLNLMQSFLFWYLVLPSHALRLLGDSTKSTLRSLLHELTHSKSADEANVLFKTFQDTVAGIPPNILNDELAYALNSSKSLRLTEKLDQSPAGHGPPSAGYTPYWSAIVKGYEGFCYMSYDLTYLLNCVTQACPVFDGKQLPLSHLALSSPLPGASSVNPGADCYQKGFICADALDDTEKGAWACHKDFSLAWFKACGGDTAQMGSVAPYLDVNCPDMRKKLGDYSKTYPTCDAGPQVDNIKRTIDLNTYYNSQEGR